MPRVISNTSPLLYLYRGNALGMMPALFSEIWIPDEVVNELAEGQRKGYDIPTVKDLDWIQIVNPKTIPQEWFALDLGPGELAVLALALEHPEYIVLLDDSLARNIAHAAGLKVWGTLKLLLEAKSQGITPAIKPIIERMKKSGMWVSEEIFQRIIGLAGER